MKPITWVKVKSLTDHAYGKARYKGDVWEIKSQHAKLLEAKGLVEYVDENARLKPVAKKKRTVKK
jgi:hypothetical protein